MFEGLAFPYFVAYLFSRIGTFHQFNLIRKKSKMSQSEPTTSTISSHYRGWDNLIYITEFFWGLSLHPIDWAISIGNLISLIFPSLILWEIYRERACRSVRNWFLIYLVFISANLSIILFDWSLFKSFSIWLGWLTLAICFCSLWGLYDKIRLIVKYRNPGHQSLTETVLKLLKDLIGIAYGFSVGFQTLFPLISALTLRGIFRIINLGIHLYYSRQHKFYLRHKFEKNYLESNLIKQRDRFTISIKNVNN